MCRIGSHVRLGISRRAERKRDLGLRSEQLKAGTPGGTQGDRVRLDQAQMRYKAPNAKIMMGTGPTALKGTWPCRLLGHPGWHRLVFSTDERREQRLRARPKVTQLGTRPRVSGLQPRALSPMSHHSWGSGVCPLSSQHPGSWAGFLSISLKAPHGSLGQSGWAGERDRVEDEGPHEDGRRDVPLQPCPWTWGCPGTRWPLPSLPCSFLYIPRPLLRVWPRISLSSPKLSGEGEVSARAVASGPPPYPQPWILGPLFRFVS